MRFAIAILAAVALVSRRPGIAEPFTARETAKLFNLFSHIVHRKEAYFSDSPISYKYGKILENVFGPSVFPFY